MIPGHIDLYSWDDWYSLLSQTSRAFAIILLAVAGGLMARYYLTQPRMPVKAFIGYACFSVALLGTEAYKIVTPGPYRWWLSPFVIAGSISVILGVLPAVQWRRGRVQKGKKP